MHSDGGAGGRGLTMSGMKHNKHILVAMIIAPILAVLSYFAAGHLFGEKPQTAVEGGTYRLAEKPNCRWDSGRCGLRNADFELEMSILQRGPESLTVALESVHALDGVMLALVAGEDGDDTPLPMTPTGADGRGWSIEIPLPRPGLDRIRLGTMAGGASYYGEVSTEFTRLQESSESG